MSIKEPTFDIDIPARRPGIHPLALLSKVSEGRYWAYFLILPSLILVALVILYPVLHGINLSFQELRLTRPQNNGFIGLEHYRELLLEDKVFRIALWNTAIYVGGGVIAQFIVGLVAALALNKGGIVMKAASVVVLLPWILPSVVAGNIWALMLDARLGVLNDIF